MRQRCTPSFPTIFTFSHRYVFLLRLCCPYYLAIEWSTKYPSKHKYPSFSNQSYFIYSFIFFLYLFNSLMQNLEWHFHDRNSWYLNWANKKYALIFTYLNLPLSLVSNSQNEYINSLHSVFKISIAFYNWNGLVVQGHVFSSWKLVQIWTKYSAFTAKQSWISTWFSQ